jgi:hypothetical protein
MLVKVFEISQGSNLAMVNPVSPTASYRKEGVMLVTFNQNRPPEIGKTYSATPNLRWVHDRGKSRRPQARLCHGHIDNTTTPLEEQKTYKVNS